MVKVLLEKEIQVKSQDRVRDHGEVLTARREVEAMLDLVKNESERIDSRFLEPACGDGNFLVAILERKLKIVAFRYKSKQVDFEVQMLSALASIYGIDLLKSVKETARNLLKDFMNKNGITAPKLAEKLNETCGRSSSRTNILNKLSRSSFSLIEFIQILEAYGYEIDIIKKKHTDRASSSDK